MLKKERQAYILHQVNLHNKVLSADLSLQMKVSDDTIRRDLHELSEMGKIIKVHGGALSPSFHTGAASISNIYSYSKKQIIAQKAVSLIQDGMFVLTGGGTTILEMARTLPSGLQATFISGSIPAVFEYMNHPSIHVIVIGDKVSKQAKMTVGSEAIARIREIKADLCFMGINAISLESGISDNDWEVVQMKKAMIASSQKLVCLTISEKINTVQPFQVCACGGIHSLITELPPDHPLLQPYVEAGVHVI